MNEQEKTMNTGIMYLPLPEPQLELIKPEQSLNYKHQIEQDFFIRYPYLNQNELNKIFHHYLDETTAHHYQITYENLYQTLFQSILKNLDINEEIFQIKHLLKYQNEIYPLLIHNHKLSKHEKKILYHFLTNIWQKFDEHIQNEIHLQNQLEQIQNQHKYLLNMKIKQEQYQTFYLQIQDIQNEIIHLKQEIQQLSDYKHGLQNEISEIKTHCSHHLIEIDYLKSTVIRSYINQLNNLQLERDSLITDIELIKYNLFEQKQEYNHILTTYRQSLNHFRLTINQLEQQLNNEFIHLQIINISSCHNDTNKLIVFLENQIQEKNTLNNQLKKLIENFNEKIFKQKQLLIKKTNDYQTMENIEQQLHQNIHIYREIYLQLKTERRTIEHQLKTKLKQHTTDEHYNHTLNQQYDSLLARKKLEQIRINTLNNHLNLLIDEKIRLENNFQQLNNQYQNIHSKNLLKLQEDIFNLKSIQENSFQEKLNYQKKKQTYENFNEQLQKKFYQISNRIYQILKRIKQNNINSKENHKYIQILENKLNEEQQYYFQSNSILKQMQNCSESYRTKQYSIQKQIQIASNNIQNSQYRLKTFTEQLFICHKDLIEHRISLKKLREFYFILKEQDEINLKKFSIISNQLIDQKNQYQILKKSLEQINEDLIKYSNIRIILTRLIIQRINLCQLLYKELSQFNENIHQINQNIQMIIKYIKKLKNQIHHIRNQNKKFLENNDQYQLEILKIHMNKMLDHSRRKQRSLTKRHLIIKSRLNPLPIEESTYLKTKYYLLKNRLIKIILRGIFSNLIFLSIEQDFFHYLQLYTLKSHRKYSINLNSLRINLYQLIRQLKSKTAENNMLIDYHYYFQFIFSKYNSQFIKYT